MLAAVTDEQTGSLPAGPRPTWRPGPVGWRRWVVPLAAAAAIGAHLVIGLAYAASGLLAPGWAVAVLALCWFALGALLLWLAARRSLWCLAVPFAALALWALVISAGGAWLGWTA